MTSSWSVRGQLTADESRQIHYTNNHVTYSGRINIAVGIIENMEYICVDNDIPMHFKHMSILYNVQIILNLGHIPLIFQLKPKPINIISLSHSIPCQMKYNFSDFSSSYIIHVFNTSETSLNEIS